MAVTYYPRSKAVKQVEILFGSKTLPLHFGSAVFHDATQTVIPRLPLMIRTGGFAKQSSGSAALETKGFARAGRGLQAARDC